MTYIITSLCLRDSGCVDVCPVECIVPGKPVEEWPWYYIDPDTCIDCGACIRECPTGTLVEKEKGYRVLLGGRVGGLRRRDRGHHGLEC